MPPVASWPWQAAHCSLKSWCPACTLSGVAGGAKIEEYGSFVFSMWSAFIPLPRCRKRPESGLSPQAQPLRVLCAQDAPQLLLSLPRATPTQCVAAISLSSLIPYCTCRRIADVCGTFGVGERLLLAFRRDSTTESCLNRV